MAIEFELSCIHVNLLLVSLVLIQNSAKINLSCTF